MNQVIHISKEFLFCEYVEKEKTIKQIAEENQVSVGLVFNRLREYEIQTRPAITEKTREKISQAKIGKPSPMKGKHLSNEAKKKISNTNKGFRKPTKYGGHKKKRKDGYISVYCPENGHSSKDGYIMEHILIMEEFLGRSLAPDEVVHHKNHIWDDNRIENLQVMTKHDHMSLHMKERHEKRRNDLLTA